MTGGRYSSDTIQPLTPALEKGGLTLWIPLTS